jgi:hypothetical protein
MLDALSPGGEMTAANALVIDRARNLASIAPVAEARAFVRSQWPPEPPLTAEQAAEIHRRTEELIAQGWQEVRVDPAEALRLYNLQRGQVGRLFGWLELCPDAGQEGREK